MAIRSSVPWKVLVPCVIAMMAVLPAPAAAQGGSTAIPTLRIGDIVWVTSAGRTTKGRVWTISADSIVVSAGQSITFKRADIQQIHRQVPDSSRDGLWKGALIGAGIGALVGLATDKDYETFDIISGPVAAALGGMFGAAGGMPTGLLVDRAHHKRESIPLATPGASHLEVRAVMSPSRVGSQISIRW